MRFFISPLTSITRLYFWLGCLAGLGSRGIFVDQCGDVFGDGHVVAVCEFYDFVFEFGWDFEGEGGWFVG